MRVTGPVRETGLLISNSEAKAWWDKAGVVARSQATPTPVRMKAFIVDSPFSV